MKKHKCFVILYCPLVAYGSETDEEVYFEWLKQIKSTKRIAGAGSEIQITLGKGHKIPRKCFQELLSFFTRYKIDKKQLLIFENESNKDLFQTPLWKEKQCFCNKTVIPVSPEIHCEKKQKR